MRNYGKVMPHQQLKGPPAQDTGGRGMESNMGPRVNRMTLYELKRQTAMRLAQAEGGIDESSSGSADNISPQVPPLVQREHVHTAAPVIAQPQPQYRGTRPSGYPQQQGQQGFHLPLPLRRVESSPGPRYAADSSKRNYTNTQLGLGGGGRGGGTGGNNSPPQGGPNNNTNVLGMTQQQQQPCSTTPRVKQRAAVLKDRGSTENTSPTSPSHSNSSNKGNHHNRGRGGGRGGDVGGESAAAGGGRGGRSSPTRRNKPQQSVKTDGCSGGRRTPVRDHIITGGGQKLFASPATTPVYGEPPRGSGNNNNKYSPHSGGYSYGGRGGSGGTYYGNNMMDHQKQLQQQQQQQHQSKLPHGLTVQELKEMTRARLAAEAEGGQLDDDQSIHSSGTRLSLGSGDHYVGAPSQSNEYSYHTNHGGWPYQQGRPQQQQQMKMHSQMHQMQAPPNSHSPHYISHPRHPSPVFDSALDTKSTDSSTIAPDYGPLHTTTAESSRYHHKTFYASPNNMNGIQFNRARCLSAGATNIVPYSFGLQQHQQQRVVFYDSNISPSTTAASAAAAAAANIQRCATTSPGAIMSRLREDQQHLFTTYERDRLAIPPLSEPRMRTRAATTMMGVDCLTTVSATPSAFEPIFNDSGRPKLTTYDRSFSNMSGTSAMGELPSLMAEAVLDSMKGVAPIGGDVIVGPTSSSPFRPTEKEMTRGGGGGRSPFLVSSLEESPENIRSAFRLSSLLTDSSGGSMSLENVFTSDISGNRLLLGTQSWDTQNNQNSNTNSHDISDDFSSMLSFAGVNGPALRGRAATEPLWFRGSDANLVSHLDPEYNCVGDQEEMNDEGDAFGYGKSEQH